MNAFFFFFFYELMEWSSMASFDALQSSTFENTWAAYLNTSCMLAQVVGDTMQLFQSWKQTMLSCGSDFRKRPSLPIPSHQNQQDWWWTHQDSKLDLNTHPLMLSEHHPSIFVWCLHCWAEHIFWKDFSLFADSEHFKTTRLWFNYNWYDSAVVIAIKWMYVVQKPSNS